MGHEQLIYILRVVLAALCGGLIGIERSRRQKEAGIRTHVIVALGAALAMVVSKYAFFDVVVFDSIQLDASRIASNVITGISFLGAGVIFHKGDSTRGLTTAAGVWTTAGIGLAVGAGMYVTGICATVLVVVIQFTLHKVLRRLEYSGSSLLTVTLSDDPEALREVCAYLQSRDMQICSCQYVRTKPGQVELRLSVRAEKNMSVERILALIKDRPEIQAVIY